MSIDDKGGGGVVQKIMDDGEGKEKILIDTKDHQ